MPCTILLFMVMPVCVLRCWQSENECIGILTWFVTFESMSVIVLFVVKQRHIAVPTLGYRNDSSFGVGMSAWGLTW